MPFVGTGHIWLLLIVLAIVLIVKGPGKLPEMGAGLGRALREFRAAMRDEEAPARPVVLHDEPADTSVTPR